jgi:hypothetical protein
VDSWWVAVISLPVVIGIIGVTALLRAPRDAQPEVLRALAEVVREALRPLAPSRWTKPELGTPADDSTSSPPGSRPTIESATASQCNTQVRSASVVADAQQAHRG